MQTINYLPDVLKDIKEFRLITSCSDAENHYINIAVKDLYNDQFITTTEKSIKRYEKMLGIVFKGTDTLEDRRLRVLSIYNMQLPYTKTILEQNLITFCGENGYSLNIDIVNNIVTVKILLIAKSMFDTIKNYLENFIPLNMIIDLSLLYNQWLTVKNLTWDQASEYTWKQFREEVVT